MNKLHSFFFIKSRWFFVVSISFLFLFALWLFSNIGQESFIFSFKKIIFWEAWNFISTVILIITFIAIAYQSYYTKKYTEFSVAPNAFFRLRTISRLELMINGLKNETQITEELSKKPIKERVKTLFIVRNNSRFPIIFKVKIEYKYKKKIIKKDNTYWLDKLDIFPGDSKYPGVIILDDIVNDDYKDGEIEATIRYKCSPIFAPEINFNMPEYTWRFDLKESKWIGPQGVAEENLIF